jgi:hypothetical protein
LNPSRELDFRDATGLALSGETLWLTLRDSVYFCQLNSDLTPQHFVTLPYLANGVAVRDSTIYITSKKAGYIFVYNRDTGREITRLYAPGVGAENITVRMKNFGFLTLMNRQCTASTGRRAKFNSAF